MKEEVWSDRCERYFTSMADGEKRSLSDTHMKTSVKSRLVPDQCGRFAPLLRYLSGLDLHGTSLLVQCQSVPAFIFWMVVCMAGVASLSYLITIRVENYLNTTPQFILTSHDVANPSLKIPIKVSVCNLNLLRKSTLREGRFKGLLDLEETETLSMPFTDLHSVKNDAIFRNTKLERFCEKFGGLSMLEHSRAEFEMYRGMLSPSDWLTLYRNAREGDLGSLRKALRPTRAELYEHGMNMKDDLLHCWQSGIKCREKDVVYTSEDRNGNCVDIDLKSPVVDGLSLILNTRPEEYLGAVTSSLGFMVRVHAGSNQSDYSEVLLVSPGHTLNINIHKVSEFSRRKPCIDATDYTYKTCQQRCLEDLSRDICRCHVSMDTPLHDRCRVNKEYEYVCASVLEEMLAAGHLPCTCQRRCRNSHISTSASYTTWPTSGHQVHLLESLYGKGYHGNTSDITSELVQIKVAASDTVYERYTQTQSSIFTLLVELGGLSALMCGASLVTCLQVVCGLLQLIFSAYKKSFKRSMPVDGVRQLRQNGTHTVAICPRPGNQNTAPVKPLPRGQYFLDPIKEIDTPRTDHTYEDINSRTSPRDVHGEPFSPPPGAQAVNNWSRPYRKLSYEGGCARRGRWSEPMFGSLGRSGVVHGDDVNHNMATGHTDKRKQVSSPRRKSWSDKPSVPALDLSNLQKADGFWMWNNKQFSSKDESDKRTKNGHHVLTSNDFTRRYGIPQAHDTNCRTHSTNVFYM